jgi:hypothetical protein
VDKVVGRNGKIKVNVHPTYVGFDLLNFPDNAYPVLTDQHTLDEQRIKRIRDLQCEPRVIEVVRLFNVPQKEMHHIQSAPPKSHQRNTCCQMHSELHANFNIASKKGYVKYIPKLYADINSVFVFPSHDWPLTNKAGELMLMSHGLQVHPDWYRVQMVLNGWTWAEEPMPTTHIQTATKVFEHKLATARKFKYAEV